MVAVLSITPVSNNTLYQPTKSIKADVDARQDSDRHADSIKLSDYAKELLATKNLQGQSKDEEKDSDAGKESVQISSSVGRVSRVTGLQREDVAALYRSIDKLT